MVLNFISAGILPHLGDPLLDFLRYLILEELLILEFDVFVGGIFLVNEERDLLQEDGELVLGGLAVFEDAVDLVLVLPAVVEENDGSDSDRNVQIIDNIDKICILRSVFVVS